MTQKKKLKRAIRARARKTGESYTAARRQLLASRRPSPTPAPPAPRTRLPSARPAPSRGAISEAAVLRKTGHGLDHWFAVLDAHSAKSKGHTAAARHLYATHGLPGWYAQGITVSWERARGLRAMNQSCTGTFQVSVSKTVPVSVRRVAAFLTDARRRKAWLAGADASLRQALEAAFRGPKPRTVTVKREDYARMRYPWDGGTVEIYLYGKPNGCSVVAHSSDLADGALVETRRAQWRAALGGLVPHLTA
jgi:hypothetical protein